MVFSSLGVGTLYPSRQFYAQLLLLPDCLLFPSQRIHHPRQCFLSILIPAGTSPLKGCRQSICGWFMHNPYRFPASNSHFRHAFLSLSNFRRNFPLMTTVGNVPYITRNGVLICTGHFIGNLECSLLLQPGNEFLKASFCRQKSISKKNFRLCLSCLSCIYYMSGEGPCRNF